MVFSVVQSCVKFDTVNKSGSPSSSCPRFLCVSYFLWMTNAVTWNSKSLLCNFGTHSWEISIERCKTSSIIDFVNYTLVLFYCSSFKYLINFNSISTLLNNLSCCWLIRICRILCCSCSCWCWSCRRRCCSWVVADVAVLLLVLLSLHTFYAF